MISISHNWLFIHISRTGGNSIQSVLARYSEDRLTSGDLQDGIDRFGVQGPYTRNKHFRLQDYADAVPPEIFSKLFKFTVVRNPWARAISWFFMPLKWISMGRQPHWSADEFQRDIGHMPSMAPMLEVNGVPGQLDMLLRFETLETDFAALTARLGITSEAALPHRNRKLAYLLLGIARSGGSCRRTFCERHSYVRLRCGFGVSRWYLTCSHTA